MKKWLLAILFLVGFCQMDGQSKLPLPGIVHCRIHSFESKNHPPQQLTIPEFNFTTGQNNRQQNADGLFDYTVPGANRLHYRFQNTRSLTDLGQKHYLLHIYPSHNFW